MYDYQKQRPWLFTEEGQVTFLKIRDEVKRIIDIAGCVRMDKAIAGCTGSSWDMLACVDRLVELNEIQEVTKQGDVAGQHRIFVSAASF